MVNSENKIKIYMQHIIERQKCLESIFNFYWFSHSTENFLFNINKSPNLNEARNSCFCKPEISLDNGLKYKKKFKNINEIEDPSIDLYSTFLKYNFENPPKNHNELTRNALGVSRVEEIQNLCFFVLHNNIDYDALQVIPLKFSVKLFIKLTEDLFCFTYPSYILQNQVQKRLTVIISEIDYVCDLLNNYLRQIQEDPILKLHLEKYLRNIHIGCKKIFLNFLNEPFENSETQIMVLKYYNSYKMLIRSFYATYGILNYNGSFDMVYKSIVLLNANKIISHLNNDLIFNKNCAGIIEKVLVLVRNNNDLFVDFTQKNLDEMNLF